MTTSPATDRQKDFAKSLGVEFDENVTREDINSQIEDELSRHDNDVEYSRFTGPQRLDKTLHSLEGILKGIAADGVVTAEEVELVREWLRQNGPSIRRHPFSEIKAVLDEALADGVLDDDEVQDLLWLCARFTTTNAYFDDITSDMQRLQGLLGGIAADGVISKDELDGLNTWMEDHENLRGCWPYDELESLIITVLKDGRIDEEEHRLLVAFFSEFLSYKGHSALGDHVQVVLNEVDKPISGLCAMCPEIAFDNRLFCFTGTSERATRSQLAAVVERQGGRFSRSLTKDVDYLIIGGAGNKAWAFACYGRKVEQAVQHRKQGGKVLIVHEFDFWDTIEE